MMKIAVACCGLGHVRRGIEVWAATLADALHRKGVDVTLFKGGGRASEPYEIVVPCLHRGDAWSRCLAGVPFPGKWRTPLASPYYLESWTFSRRLLPFLKSDYDIVHLQDPHVAMTLLHAKQRGRIRPHVLLANGTEETPDFLAQFEFLQELDAYGMDSIQDVEKRSVSHRYVVPNFVDTDVFAPGDRVQARRAFGLPEDAYIVLAVGAIQRQLKRMDYVIEEFGRFVRRGPGKPLLLLAGARTDETDEMRALACREIGPSFRFMENLSHADMPMLYRVADVFVFPVLHGIYGIALAEAAASGLPCVVHDWERVRWVAGPEAVVGDLREKGGLDDAIWRLRNPVERERISAATRKWAEQALSTKGVIRQYIEMYQDIVVTA